MSEQVHARLPFVLSVLVFSLSIFQAGCSKSPSKPGPGEASAEPVTPRVTNNRRDLIFSWIGDAGPQVATSIEDVPPNQRSEVRVQDPTIPPEKRDNRWLFFADLTRPDIKGEYPVRAVSRSEYENARSEELRSALPEQNIPPAGQRAPEGQSKGPGTLSNADPNPSGESTKGGTAGAEVVMYATRHCPVCIKARRWLIAEGIPYLEKDIERDRQAAESLAAKGRKQGIPVNGVPVFEIRGQLVPGFDPGVIRSLVRGHKITERTI